MTKQVLYRCPNCNGTLFNEMHRDCLLVYCADCNRLNNKKVVYNETCCKQEDDCPIKLCKTDLEEESLKPEEVIDRIIYRYKEKKARA